MAEIFYFKMLLFMASLLSVSGGDAEVSCAFRESCMLPCQFQPGSDPVIHWNKVSAGDSVVHSYYTGRDQLGYQDQNFKSRTSVFQDQISRGNASLLLKGVKIIDEGRYKCYTSTHRGFTESFINLKTDAPVSAVSISQEGDRINCSSEGIYPQPELSWSTIPPSNITLNESTSIQQAEDQLYSISSSLMVSDGGSGLSYSCTVRTRSNNMTSDLSKPESSQQREALIGKVIGGLIGAAAVVIGMVARCLCKRSGSPPGGNPNETQRKKSKRMTQNTKSPMNY